LDAESREGGIRIVPNNHRRRMPYIKESARYDLDLGDRSPESAGELNYAITQICRRYWAGAPNYQAINDIVGALEGAKLEFYRRVAAKYEDQKIEENGDVY
jgi:hypothetical protein